MTRKQNFLRRGLAALLAAAICCGPLSLAAAARETSAFSRWPQDVPLEARDGWKESEQTFTAELNKALEALTAAAKANAPAAGVTALYDQAKERLSALQTNYAFTEIACGQSQADEADLDRWFTALENGRNAFAEAERSLFAGDYQAAFREKLGEAYVDAALAKPACFHDSSSLCMFFRGHGTVPLFGMELRTYLHKYGGQPGISRLRLKIFEEQGDFRNYSV